MSAFLTPSKPGRLKYDRNNLQRAYEATRTGVSVYKAARMYAVPESTLRDRTRGNVPLNSKVGYQQLFTAEEEKRLVDHISYMGDIGYGYNVSKIKYMARDYALQLEKHVKSKDSMSDCWFYDFLKRWPNLKIAKPQKLSMSRAKSASRPNIDAYYQELESILTRHKLHDRPENIFNIDETGISTEHAPPKIVCNKNVTPQAITSSRDKLVTIIAGGNALENSIPPYYVFPGKRWNDDFMKQACPGSAGEMTKNGWSNTEVFQKYIMNHLPKYANLSRDTPTLILYDGHKSHISLTLTEWAKDHNVILFVLPPHTSHITQPLDVGVFGPLKAMYNKECHTYMQQNPGITITKYDVAHLTARPYLKALCPENIVHAFKKTGVFPFNRFSICDSQVAPAVIFCESSGDNVQHSDDNAHTHPNCHTICDPVITQEQNSQAQQQPHTPASPVALFFEKRTITKVITNKRKRKFIPPYLSGSLLRKENIEIMTQPLKKSNGNSEKKTEPCTSNADTIDCHSDNTQQDIADDDVIPQDIINNDVCCVCHNEEPESDFSGLPVAWGKCDFCPHWTHLKFCSRVRALTRASVFSCPHCKTNN